MNYNRVVLGGCLTANPETKQGKTPFVVFSLAINDRDKNVNFLPCIAFGKTGEMIAKYFAKGKEIFVEGRLTSRKSEKQTYYSVVVERFEFCGYQGDKTQTTPNGITMLLAPPSNNNPNDIPF